jgi:hypothetical protein
MTEVHLYLIEIRNGGVGAAGFQVQVITDRSVKVLMVLVQTMLLMSRVGSSLGSFAAVVKVRVAGKDKTPLEEIP